jgi:hypothetical protein
MVVSEDTKTLRDLLEAIHSSRGMQHIDRSHERTFTLNLFRMNAQELIEITRRVNDPDEAMRLMAVDNKEAGQQTHREVTRRAHNFVAAALTLVEHTRIFMRDNYGDLPIFGHYQSKVDADFAHEPLAKFVKDLRNYMLHKGLPNSEMYLNFESKPDRPEGGSIETGIHIRTAPLLEWDRWSLEARTYVESCGEFVDVRTFAEAYTDRTVAFYSWLQGELDQFHSTDLDELRALEETFSKQQAAANPVPEATTQTSVALHERAEEPEQEFTFAPARAAVLDAAGTVLLGKVRELVFQAPRGVPFTSERPIVATITDKDMLSTPLVWATDVEGRRVFSFIHKDGAAYGLDEYAFSELQPVTESVLKSEWARRTLSRRFVEKTLIEWLQANFGVQEVSGLAETIAEESQKAVRPLELWVPIAHLETAAPFAVGPAEVATITRAMLDRLETEALSFAPQEREKTAQVYNDLRQRMQGFAAVVIKSTAEARKLEEDGEIVARIVVAFLRYFSPAAVSFPAASANALLGSELVPRSHLLVLGKGTFSYKQSILGPYPGWGISEAELQQMRPGLDIVGALVRPEGLSAFARTVRSSLLLFSTGTTFSNPIERLSYTLSSVEALLLRHSAEPPEFNVAERIGFLATSDRTERENVRRNVREAYRLRVRQDISPIAPREMTSVAVFLQRAHQVIGTALINVDRFATVSDFVSAVENTGKQTMAS